MEVVLVHPDIPQNTGNIARTCVATCTTLHLIEPLGFSLEDRWLKRAGLDYWKDLTMKVHTSFEDFLRHAGDRPMYLFSRFAQTQFWDAKFENDGFLIFGSETSGLPDEIKQPYSKHLYRIPTPGNVRSLNLSTSVGIVLFEAIRQNRKI